AILAGPGSGTSDSGATALNGAGTSSTSPSATPAPGAPGSALPGGAGPGAPAGTGSTLPGSSGPASGAGAAGQPGATAPSAGPGGSATASAGALPRVVTPTTVRVGFFLATNQNTVNHAAGINGLNNTGDAQAQVEAMVKWVNSHGGIAGHAIDPQFISEDASNTDPNYQTQLCHEAVDDDQVFAMVDDNNALQDATQ